MVVTPKSRQGPKRGEKHPGTVQFRDMGVPALGAGGEVELRWLPGSAPGLCSPTLELEISK